MRSLGTRRVALAAGVATVAVIGLGACSAGQVAETALLDAPISGVDAQSPDGRLLIRNLQVIYNNPTRYPANSNAPLEVSLYNTTKEPLTVLVSSAPAEEQGQAGVVSARQVGVAGGTAATSPSAAPEPSGSRPANYGVPGDEDQNGGVSQPSVQPSVATGAPSVPPATALQPARITLPALGNAVYLPQGDAQMVAVGLTEQLRPGNSLNLVFEVNGAAEPITVKAPFAIPLSPASRAPGEDPNDHMGEAEEAEEGN